MSTMEQERRELRSMLIALGAKPWLTIDVIHDDKGHTFVVRLAESEEEMTNRVPATHAGGRVICEYCALFC